jgi:hypothetical protein
MNHLTAVLYFVGTILGIGASIFGAGRWAHSQIVKSVKEQLAPIDSAVNHRQPGQPPLVKVADDSYTLLVSLNAKVDSIERKLERHA